MFSYVTHCDSDYAIRCIAMLRSLKLALNGSIAQVYCHDEDAIKLLYQAQIPSVIIRATSELEEEFPELKLAKMNRTRLEYYYALTPFLIRNVMSESEFNEVHYVDADIFFFTNPTLSLKMLPNNPDAAIVHHRFDSHLAHLEKFGLYNVGWLAFNKSVDAKLLLQWWSDRCLESTSRNVTNEIFGDQKYLDKFHSIIPGVYCISKPGINEAPWNCSQASIERSNLVVEQGEQLVFFHFSGLRIGKYLTVLGYAAYSKRATCGIRRLVYGPYLKELTKICIELTGKPPRDFTRYSIREILRQFYYLDLAITTRSKP